MDPSTPWPTEVENVDAAIFSDKSGSGIGALIRDEYGKVVGALSKRLPNPYSAFVAECIAIREGLCFAKSLGLQCIDVESDCLLAVQSVSKSIPSVINSVLHDIRDLFVELRGGSCSYIPRSCNIAAHTLAQESITLSSHVSWISQSPPCILQHIAADALS